MAAEVSSKYAVQMHGITKRFGSFYALTDVDLDVEKGTIHSILGENGAGKSTLMNVLYGLYQADMGEIYIGGKQVAADSDEKINFYEIASGEKLTVAKLIKDGILKKYDGADKHAKKDETEYRLTVSDEDFAKDYVTINTSGSILTSGTKKDGDDYKIHLSKVAGGATINGKSINTATISYVILK